MEMPWDGRLKIMKISRWAILGLAIAAAVFIGVTIYGANIGNFLIGIKDRNDRGNANLVLSEHADFSHQTPLLTAKGLREQADCVKSSLGDVETLIDGIGSKNDNALKSYQAFSFYLMNIGDEVVDYNYSFVLSDDNKGVYEAIRIWIIESGVDNDIVTDTVYAYHEDDMEAYEQGRGYEEYEWTDFIDETVVCDGTTTIVRNFAPGDIMKYTVAIWLEGPDPQCTENLIGGRMKALMTFDALTG